jgi:PXPV repeat (3 copies)
MKYLFTTLRYAAAAALMIAAPLSMAHDRVNWSVTLGSQAPIYSPPPVVYVQPQPVYVEPAPVYVRPAPVYVQPSAYVQYGRPYYVEEHRHNHHKRHWKHDYD